MSDLDTRDGLGAIFDLCAAVNVQIGATQKLAEKMSRELSRRTPAVPVFFPQSQTDVTTAGGVAILRFGGPDQGHFWYVRHIYAGSPSIATATAAGRCDIFVSASDLRQVKTLFSGVELASVGVGDLHWSLGRGFNGTTGLPDMKTFGRGEVTLRFNEELFLIFTGMGAAAAVAGHVRFEDFEESAVESVFAE